MTESTDPRETLLHRLEFAYENPIREHLLWEAHHEIDRLRVRLATAERHLRIVSVHRGTAAANRILDYWLPLTELAEDALDD